MAARSGATVVAITGGLSGIGAATALAFAARGAYVSLWDRELSGEVDAVEQVQAVGGQGEAVKVDVRRYQAVEAAAHQLLARQGRIDILVAAAGIADQSGVDTGDPDRWRDVVTTNLLGSIYAVRAVLPACAQLRPGTSC